MFAPVRVILLKAVPGAISLELSSIQHCVLFSTNAAVKVPTKEPVLLKDHTIADGNVFSRITAVGAEVPV